MRSGSTPGPFDECVGFIVLTAFPRVTCHNPDLSAQPGAVNPPPQKSSA